MLYPLVSLMLFVHVGLLAVSRCVVYFWGDCSPCSREVEPLLEMQSLAITQLTGLAERAEFSLPDRQRVWAGWSRFGSWELGYIILGSTRRRQHTRPTVLQCLTCAATCASMHDSAGSSTECPLTNVHQLKTWGYGCAGLFFSFFGHRAPLLVEALLA